MIDRASRRKATEEPPAFAHGRQDSDPRRRIDHRQQGMDGRDGKRGLSSIVPGMRVRGNMSSRSRAFTRDGIKDGLGTSSACRYRARTRDADRITDYRTCRLEAFFLRSSRATLHRTIFPRITPRPKLARRRRYVRACRFATEPPRAPASVVTAAAQQDGSSFSPLSFFLFCFFSGVGHFVFLCHSRIRRSTRPKRSTARAVHVANWSARPTTVTFTCRLSSGRTTSEQAAPRSASVDADARAVLGATP